MLGRYEDAPEFAAEAQALGSSAPGRSALGRHRDFPPRSPAVSGARLSDETDGRVHAVGPVIDGQTPVWHLEKLAGADAVLTVFPNIFEAFLTAYTGLDLPPQIDDPIPEEVLERLLRIPYFAAAYHEHGLPPEAWVRHPALLATGNTFARSMEAIERFAAQCARKSNDHS